MKSIQNTLEEIQFNTDVLNAIKENLDKNDFNMIYSLSSKFIYENHLKLWSIIQNSACSLDDRIQLLNLINQEHKKYRLSIAKETGQPDEGCPTGPAL